MQTKFIKLGTAISSAVLVAASFLTPALALDVTISGNGASSESEVEVKHESDVDVDQSNVADIDNDVDIDQDTGGNKADWNTGGDVSVESGDASSDVTISNIANANTAEVSACCPGGDVEVTIKDNGAFSDNKVELKNDSDVDLDQDNDADFDNDVDVDQDSGDNKANNNTNGDVSVTSGDIHSSVTVDNMANVNSARLTGSSDPATLSVLIAGNGAQSENEVEIDNDSDVDLDQDNDADFDNDVDVDQDSGDNKAKWNTGGEVSIEGGDVDSTVDISNIANFNWADLDACGCAFDEDSTLTIKDNGAFSDNDFELKTDSDVDADQDNDADFDNDADVDQDTGDNKVKGSTATGDPAITSGDASSSTTVENEGNSNVLNGEVDLELPADLGELVDLLSALLALLS